MTEASVRLHVLGEFRLARDGFAVSTLPRKVQSLLAFLALHPEPHPREKLAALLWGDSPDRQARASLRTVLKTLREQLGEHRRLAIRPLHSRVERAACALAALGHGISLSARLARLGRVE